MFIALKMRLHFFSLLAMLLFLASCDKPGTTGQQPGEFLGSTVVFKISGIQQDAESGGLKTKSAEKKDSTAASSLLESHGEIELLTSVDPNYREGEASFKASQPMEVGHTYRVELFKVVGGTEQHYHTIDQASDDLITLDDAVVVEYNSTYRWYAYSYNNTDPITVQSGSEQVPMGNNKDFLYDSGSFTVDFYDNKPLFIVFKRQTARFQIEVDGRGMSANDITALSVTLSTGMLKTGNFSLKQGSVVASSLTDLTTPVLNLSNFSNVTGPYRKRSAYFHSAAASGSANLTLSASALTILAQNNYSTSVSATRNLTAAGAIPLNFGASSFALGKSTLLKVDLLESGLRYGTTTVGALPVTWARSNVYYHQSTGDHRYRLYPQNVQTRDPNTFFSFQGHIPLHFADKTNVKDPCALIYPAGRWKTPTFEELDVTPQLIGSSGILGNLLNGLVELLIDGDNPSTASYVTNNAFGSTSYYTSYDISPADQNSQYAATSRKLMFPYNGEHVVSNVLGINSESLVELNLGTTYNRYAAYWTSTQGANVLGLLDLGSWSYRAGQQTVVILVLPVTLHLAVGGAELLGDINLGSLDVLSSSFKNVRCTRNASWNPDAPMSTREPVY